MGSAAPSARQGVAFLLVAVVSWGLTWPINKLVLEAMGPLWMAALRSAIAAGVLVLASAPCGKLVPPPRAESWSC